MAGNRSAMPNAVYTRSNRLLLYPRVKGIRSLFRVNCCRFRTNIMRCIVSSLRALACQCLPLDARRFLEHVPPLQYPGRGPGRCVCPQGEHPGYEDRGRAQIPAPLHGKVRLAVVGAAAATAGHIKLVDWPDQSLIADKFTRICFYLFEVSYSQKPNFRVAGQIEDCRSGRSALLSAGVAWAATGLDLGAVTHALLGDCFGSDCLWLHLVLR